MSLKQVATRERIGAADLPMNVDHGAMTITNVWAVMGLSIGSLAIAALGAFIFYLCWPSEYAIWSGWRVIGVVFGICVGGTAVIISWITLSLAIETWRSHEWRKNAYAEIDMEGRRKTGNIETEREVIGWELLTDRPLHVLGVALAVHERVMKGEASPFSTRQLEGPVWLGGVRLGDLTPATAEETSKLLSDVGLIKGRQARQAGRWSADSEQDVIKAIVGKWARRGGSDND